MTISGCWEYRGLEGWPASVSPFPVEAMCYLNSLSGHGQRRYYDGQRCVSSFRRGVELIKEILTRQQPLPALVVHIGPSHLAPGWPSELA